MAERLMTRAAAGASEDAAGMDAQKRPPRTTPRRPAADDRLLEPRFDPESPQERPEADGDDERHLRERPPHHDER
jgi:hypothetical protein